jgi:hypothetical protein
MQAKLSPKTAFVLKTKAQARVFINAESRRWFYPFFAKTSTVSDAARALGEPANSVLYRVKEWCKLGLLNVVNEEKRHGRTVKLYRSVADEFFMPHDSSETEDLIEFLRVMNTPYLETLFKSIVHAGEQLSTKWGVQFTPDEQNDYRIFPATAPDQPWLQLSKNSPAVLNEITSDLKLSPQDAKAFQLELCQLLQKYLAKGGSDSYVCHIALAPKA